MFTSRVNPGDLVERLDADFFAPELIEADQRIARAAATFGCALSIDKIRHRATGLCYGILQPVFMPEGVPIVDLQEMKGGLVCRPQKFVDLQQHDEYLRSEVRGQDVLLSVKGTLGVVAITPPGFGPANVNRDIARLRVNPETADAYYVVAFLSSLTGNSSLCRIARGISPRSLNITDLLRFRILAPQKGAQHYIGSKVRQAEVLREWARELGRDIHASFDGLHQLEKNRDRNSWRGAAKSLNEERLDASYYSPPAVALDSRLSSADSHRLSHWVRPVRQRTFDRSQPISYFEIGGVDTSTGCAWPTVVPAAEIPSRAQWSVQPWDILVATVRPERKNVGLVAPLVGGQLVATSGFSILRASSPATAAFIWGFLRSDAATEQLMRWNTGAAYPAIDDDVPFKVWMPQVPEREMREKGEAWCRIPRLILASRNLVTSARLLVEALIERKVTEAELISASRDPAADRTLLSRLTAKGLDADGPPLFPDLAALETLLKEASRRQ